MAGTTKPPLKARAMALRHPRPPLVGGSLAEPGPGVGSLTTSSPNEGFALLALACLLYPTLHGTPSGPEKGRIRLVGTTSRGFGPGGKDRRPHTTPARHTTTISPGRQNSPPAYYRHFGLLDHIGLWGHFGRCCSGGGGHTGRYPIAAASSPGNGPTPPTTPTCGGVPHRTRAWGGVVNN